MTRRSLRVPQAVPEAGENSGTPADFAGAGYGGTISVVGTPAAYGVSTNKGNGIRLGTAAYIQATHHAVFTTTGAATANTIVESEVTFSIHCAFPAVLQNDWVIFSKADNAADLSSSVSLRVHANGSVELRVREHKYRPDVRMKTAAGVVTQGSQHHFTVSLGYAGAWFTVDGRQAELGFKNTLAWWGLDHRHNGVEEGGHRRIHACHQHLGDPPRPHRGSEHERRHRGDQVRRVLRRRGAHDQGPANRGLDPCGCSGARGRERQRVLADPRFSAVSREPGGRRQHDPGSDRCGHPERHRDLERQLHAERGPRAQAGRAADEQLRRHDHLHERRQADHGRAQRHAGPDRRRRSSRPARRPIPSPTP